MNLVVPPNSPRKPRLYRQKSVKSGGESSLDSIPIVPYADYSDATTGFDTMSSASEADSRSLGMESNRSTPRKISFDAVDGNIDQPDSTIAKRTPPRTLVFDRRDTVTSSTAAIVSGKPPKNSNSSVRKVRRRFSVEVADASTDTGTTELNQVIRESILTLTGEHVGESSTDPDALHVADLVDISIEVEGVSTKDGEGEEVDHVTGDSSTDTIATSVESDPDPVSVNEKTMQCPESKRVRKLSFLREPCYDSFDDNENKSKNQPSEEPIQIQTAKPITADSSSIPPTIEPLNNETNDKTPENSDLQGNRKRTVSHTESVDSVHSYTLQHEEGLGSSSSTDEEVDVPVRLLSVKKNACEPETANVDNEEHVNSSRATPVGSPERKYALPSR